MSTAAHLLATPYPPEFTQGARSAVTTCLRIAPEEKVTLITDTATAPIAASLAAQLAAVGCPWSASRRTTFSRVPTVSERSGTCSPAAAS